MSDQHQRFEFNPQTNKNELSDKGVEEREHSFSYANPFGDSMEAVKRAKDVSDPKSNTSDFERNLSNQFASRGGDTTNQIEKNQNKIQNNSVSSIRRSPFGKFRKETKKDVKQLLGKPPSSGRESLGQASGLPAFQGANVSRASLLSHVKQVNFQKPQQQNQQPAQWAQTAKFNDPNQSDIRYSDQKESEDKSAELVLSPAQKQKELKRRQNLKQSESLKQSLKSEKLDSQNATISSFNNLVTSIDNKEAVETPNQQAVMKPEHPSDLTMQRTNIVEQDQIIHEDKSLENEPEIIQIQKSMPDFPSLNDSIPDQQEPQIENELQPSKNITLSKLSKSKVSWTKESTLPEEEIKPYESQIENDFNTPNPEVEHEQITSKQNVSKNTSKLKSLTNKSLVLSSQDNQPVNILNMESEKYLKKSSHHKLGQEMGMPLETMDPHFEGSQQSGRALTPMEDSDEESAALRQYQTRMPNIDDGIILARSFDEKDEQEVPVGQAVKSPEEIEEERREYEEILKLGESMWLTDLFVNRPKTVIAVGGGVIFAMVCLCLGFKLYWPSLVTIRDLFDYSDIRTQLFDARRAAFGEIQRRSSPDERIPLQSVIDVNWQLLIGIECVKDDCDNILTPEGIKFMHDIDETINNDTIWHQICLQDSITNQTCMDRPEPGYFSSKASPLTIFKILFGDDLEEMTQFGIDFALFGLAQELDYFDLALPLFGSEFTRNNRQTKLMRMALTFAGPIEIDGIRYNNIEDRQETQELAIANWQADLNDKLMVLQQEKYPDYVVHTFGRSYYYRQFYRQLIGDVLWSGLAVFFCVCYVFFHTQSLFVTASSMSQILFSFPITLVIYKLIMGVSNVSSLHLLIVFVVLGISCDNIFVVFDAWEQSQMYPQFAGSLHKRMAYTFRRASLAILATSSTTAFAFLSNGFSKLMPVSAFGYFAFVIVPVNYVLIVFYFPAFLIVYENDVKHLEKRAYLFITRSCTKNQVRVERQTDPGHQIDEIEIIESNPMTINLKNDKIQTRFEDDSFITNQIFQTQRGSKTSMKQVEYYEYMQQYYQIKQKEAELAAIISSHKRNREFSASPKHKGKKLRTRQNSQHSLKIVGKNKSQSDLAIKSLQSQPSRGSKVTLIDSKHSNIDNDVKIKPNKRYHTAKNREIITEEDFENEEMKEGGHKDESNIRGKQQNKIISNNKQQKKQVKKKLRNTFIIDENKHDNKQDIFDLKSEAKIGGSMMDLHDKALITETYSKSGSDEQCQKQIQMKTNEAEKPSSKSKQQNATTERSLLQSKERQDAQELQNEQIQDIKPAEQGVLQILLDTKWNDFVRKYRWLFIIVGIAMSGYASVRSLEIQGLSQMEEFFKTTHYIQVSLDKQLNSFNVNELTTQNIRVDIMWGILGINKEGVDFYNASDFGKVDWDYEFDVSLGENQQQLFDLCQYLKTRKDLLYLEKESSLSCWIDDFKTWLDTKRQRFPVQAIVYRNQSENFYYQLHTFVNESKEGQDHLSSQNIQFIDGKLVYTRLQTLTSGSPFWPYKKKKPYWEEWDQIVDTFNRNSTKGINKALQTAGVDWCFAIMEIGLVKTMQNGLQLSIGFSLIALMLATQNIIQAVLASVTIGFIILNVLAIVAYMDWPLGSSESVGVVVCVGFAVDYVVHLAAHYIHSKAKDRNGRVRESLRELGPSILSGSVTTIGASCCLFLGLLTMFFKFGILVIATIIFSIFYSLGFFAALCHVIGPLGNFGNINYIYIVIKEKILKLLKKPQTTEVIEQVESNSRS